MPDERMRDNTHDVVAVLPVLRNINTSRFIKEIQVIDVKTKTITRAVDCTDWEDTRIYKVKRYLNTQLNHNNFIVRVRKLKKVQA